MARSGLVFFLGQKHNTYSLQNISVVYEFGMFYPIFLRSLSSLLFNTICYARFLYLYDT